MNFFSKLFSFASSNPKSPSSPNQHRSSLDANQAPQEQDEDFEVIDVRTSDEFREGHVKDALHIDVMRPDFLQKTTQLDKSKSYKLYCRSGNRSGRAVQMMKDQGFSKVENLGGLQQAARRLHRDLER